MPCRRLPVNWKLAYRLILTISRPPLDQPAACVLNTSLHLFEGSESFEEAPVAVSPFGIMIWYLMGEAPGGLRFPRHVIGITKIGVGRVRYRRQPRHRGMKMGGGSDIAEELASQLFT